MSSRSLRETLVIDFLNNSAQRFPNKKALIYRDIQLTYAEIYDAANRFANSLLNRGFRRHDRAVILLDNSPQLIIAMFGVLMAGGIFSIVNPTIKKERLKYILNHSQANAFITNLNNSMLISEQTNGTSNLKNIWICGAQEFPDLPSDLFHSFEIDTSQASQHLINPINIDQDLAALIYTSGSTGQPKGVMLTHLNIISSTSSINKYLQNTPEDLILNALPLSFDYGLYQIFLAFQVGACIMLEESFLYPFAILKRMSEMGVTGFPGMPTMFAMLLKFDLSHLQFPTLRYMTSTGASLPPAFSRRLQQLFPRTKIFSMYGMTECKRISYLLPEELLFRPTSVGKPIPNVEVLIVDDQNNELSSGQVGELIVRGSNVMRGYWEDPESTHRVLRPGRYPGETVLYTGDLFWKDEEGYLYFVSRKDNLLKSRGMLVSPKEVEDVLYELAGIREAKVFGVPDEMLGQTIKAIVAFEQGVILKPLDIIKHCSQFLENYKVPQDVEIVEALPQTETGKLALQADANQNDQRNNSV